MVELPSEKDIEKISYEILKGSKSFDVFPTPVDKIVSYAELAVQNNIDISQIHTNYLSKFPNALRKALEKVRGLLDRTEKKIYLDLKQLPVRRNFVKLHEVGHEVLPWQRTCFDILDDDDESLSTDTQEEFEAEANFFASLTLFQHDRFLSEIDKYGLGIDSSLQISKHFGASIHATLRRYVEYSSHRCALLVLENLTNCGALLRNKFQSDKFTKTFGDLPIPTNLDIMNWPFVSDYKTGVKHKTDGLISLPTDNGIINFSYHFFNNAYNGFVFLFPIGEKKSTRTKFIISA